MKYIDVEKLKKIVEQAKQRALKGAEVDEDFYCNGRADAFEEVLLEIDSLQREQPEVDLEKEIDSCWQDWISPSNQKEVEGVLPKTEFAMYARHFWNKGYNARKEESK